MSCQGCYGTTAPLLVELAFETSFFGSTKRFDEKLSALTARAKDLEDLKLDERVSDLENSDYLGHYREGGIFRIKAVEERTYGLEQC